MRRHSGLRRLKAAIESIRFAAQRENRAQAAALRDSPQIVRHCLPDTGIRSAGNITALQHVPKRNASAENEGAPRVGVARKRLSEHIGQHRPKTVLRMTVIKTVFP